MVAVLFSFEQNAFHIETMDMYIQSNIIATINKKDHQYRLIAIGKDWEDAHNICREFEKNSPFNY